MEDKNKVFLNQRHFSYIFTYHRRIRIIFKTKIPHPPPLSLLPILLSIHIKSTAAEWLGTKLWPLDFDPLLSYFFLPFFGRSSVHIYWQFLFPAFRFGLSFVPLHPPTQPFRIKNVLSHSFCTLISFFFSFYFLCPSALHPFNFWHFLFCSGTLLSYAIFFSYISAVQFFYI